MSCTQRQLDRWHVDCGTLGDPSGGLLGASAPIESYPMSPPHERQASTTNVCAFFCLLGAGLPQIGRLAQPMEVAPAYVLLASDADSSCIIVIVLQIMGGETTGG